MLLPLNPYNWQRINPDLFYGRTGLANNLVDRLIRGESFGITGGRKMGKTTLLRRVEQDLLIRGKQARDGGLLILPVYLDTLALPDNLSSDLVYQKIVQTIQTSLQELNLPIISSEQVDKSNFQDYLRNVLAAITQYRTQIIFIFDEIEPIIKQTWGRGFFANWRALLQNAPDLSDYLSAVFAGASEMFEISRDIGSPLANILSWRELKLFVIEDTAKLMCEPLQYNWSDNLIELVHQLTGGHPFLIQYVMQIVSSEDTEIAPQSVEKAKVQFLQEQKRQFQSWWDKFDDSARGIYAKLVEEESLMLPRKTILSGFGGTANRSLEVLAHTGVIFIDEEVDTIIASGSLFREWFRQFAVLEVTPNLANQLDSLLKDLERQLRLTLMDHFDSKKPSWLQNHFSKKPEKWKDFLKNSKKPEDAVLNNKEVLKLTNLGDLFELVSLGSEWGELSQYFTNIHSDKNIAKSRLKERQDHLVFVRNCIRHVNEEDLKIQDLLKAQAFCLELLESLPHQN